MEEEAPTRDAEYQRGLREAVASGVDYGIALLEERLEQQGPQVPIALVVQARLAARQGIPLEIVIGRYLAGKKLLAHFILEEAVAGDVCDPAVLQWALAAHDTAFEQLLSTITEEYRREEQRSRRPSGDRQLKPIRRLLAGQPVDPSALDYDLTGHHLGVVVGSAEPRETLRRLATEMNSRLLVVNSTSDVTWAWLGKRGPLDTEAAKCFLSSASSPSMPIGLGEGAHSCSGWRLTHRQADAAFSFAQRSPIGFARYANIGMAVSAAKDPLMTASLLELYLSPLREERDGGRTLRETLRAYFAADRNGSSAAAVLGVSRQTVANRLEAAEERLNQPLTACGDLLHAALRLEELGIVDPASRPTSG